MISTNNETDALRAELYAARRSAGSLQQSLSQVIAERDSLIHKLQKSQEQESAGELQQLRLAVQAESAARKSAEHALKEVTLERQRLQRARDELATNLLAAQQRAQVAEEDQQKAEEQLAAAMAEMRALQSRLDASSAENPSANHHPNDVSGLLEVERGRNAVLVAALSSAKDERERAQTEAAASKKRILHLEKQLQMTHSAGPPPPGVVGTSGTSNGPVSMAKSELSEIAGATDREASAQQTSALERKVAQLKASRNKLLAELDIHFVEADRLSNENDALSQALEEAREAGGVWERQAQEACAQLERLKDLLEESALWRRDTEATPPSASGGSGGGAGEAGGSNGDLNKAAADWQYCHAHMLDLEQRCMQESARSAALDLQVRALCAELTRATQASGDLGKSVLPALNGIESRLSQLLHLKAGRVQQTLQYSAHA